MVNFELIIPNIMKKLSIFFILLFQFLILFSQSTKLEYNLLSIIEEDVFINEISGKYIVEFDKPRSKDITITNNSEITTYFSLDEPEKMTSEDGEDIVYGLFSGNGKKWIISLNLETKLLVLSKKDEEFSLMYSNGEPFK